MTQEQALDILKLGRNVYLTGSAGSGKTYLLNQYIDYLKKNKVEVAVTASTGIAATHMNGMTIHAWSGLGIRDSLDEKDISELEERRYLWDRYQKTQVLIIDEVSMLHHFRLDLVDQLAKSFKRNHHEPFGGMQVVLCGDFFQLPPVSRAGEPDAHFIYHSQAWQDLNLTVCYLHEQHRQKDKDFLKILNDIRADEVSIHTHSHLKKRQNNSSVVIGESTRLYTHNADVDRINDVALEAISGRAEVYDMTSHGNKNLVETLKKSCLAPEHLSLKIGARVMFVKNNYDVGYVNGTLGRVVGFDLMAPIIETIKGKRIVANPVSWTIEEEGKVKAEISQVPLRLAWAITVHKSQGMSLDAVEMDLSRSFECGMGYVALSRVRSLEGLTLLGINDMALKVHKDVLEFDLELQKRSDKAVSILEKIPKSDLLRGQKQFIDSISPEPVMEKISTYDQTRALISEKLSLKNIAKSREVTVGTILSHLETLLEGGDIDPEVDLKYLKPEASRFKKMKEAFEKVYKDKREYKLSLARAILGRSFNFEELRLARLFLKQK